MQKQLSLLLLGAIVIGSAKSENDFIVVSPVGTFRGAELTSQSGQSFAAYRGIPFAQPPIGSLRFAKPVKMPKLQDTYDATDEGPMCIQPPHTDIGGKGIGQEDCLYLNVFTPLNITSTNSTQNGDLLKVFVYIHGGGWAIGSANQFVPGNLVVEGNVIVVTLNYRLSWLGFVKGNTPEVPGNQGTWDQLMALRWVKDNIRAFGGDDQDITLGGESSGSSSVSLLAIAEGANDLFTKGVLMSATSFLSNNGPGSTDNLLPTLAFTLGCTNSSTTNMTNAQIKAAVDCLRSLPAERYSLSQMLTTRQAITIDGHLFKSSIAELVKDQTYLESVGFYKRNYLVTSTNNEGPIAYNGMRFPIPGEKSEYDRISKFLGIPLPVFEKIILWYSHPNTSENAPLFDLLTDNAMMPSVWKFLDVHTSNRPQVSGSSYFMRWDHYPAYMPWPYKGVFHGMDLTYVFDISPGAILRAYYWITTEHSFTSQDEQLKAKLIGTLAQFMQSNQDLWAPYDQTNQSYWIFGSYSTLDHFPLKARRDFWTHTVPTWIRDYNTNSTDGPTNGQFSIRARLLMHLFVVCFCVFAY